MSRYKKDMYWNIVAGGLSLFLISASAVANYVQRDQPILETFQSFRMNLWLTTLFIGLAYCSYRRWRIDDGRYSKRVFKITGNLIRVVSVSAIVLMIGWLVCRYYHHETVTLIHWGYMFMGVIGTAKFLEQMHRESRYW